MSARKQFRRRRRTRRCGVSLPVGRRGIIHSHSSNTATTNTIERTNRHIITDTRCMGLTHREALLKDITADQRMHIRTLDITVLKVITIITMAEMDRPAILQDTADMATPPSTPIRVAPPTAELTEPPILDIRLFGRHAVVTINETHKLSKIPVVHHRIGDTARVLRARPLMAMEITAL